MQARMAVRYDRGERYEIDVRGHTVVVDQPIDTGGEDAAPTPTELFVGSLASCVAFYAGRYLTRHGISREGLGVQVSYEMATDRPARVTGIRITVLVPKSLPTHRLAAMQAVVEHCTVHNSLVDPPHIDVILDSDALVGGI